MLFADLIEIFGEIARSSSRRHSTALLAGLFERPRATPEDVRIIPYLLQGRLGPPYAAPDLGLNARRVSEAIARASGTPIGTVWREFQQSGDLGTVAADLIPPGEGEPSLAHVYADLLTIANASGPGSADEKVHRFAGLLRLVGGDGDRYLVRIAVGTLRLGIGDATLIEALALACTGRRPLAPQIERAYSVCSDLGLVAEQLFNAGPAALEAIKPEPGRPVLPALAERLPSSDAIIQALGPVFAEPKYDGLRLQVQKGGTAIWLFTRRLENVSHAFPEIVRAACQQVRANRAILDGEIIGYDPRTGQFLPFQETTRRRRTHQIEEHAIEVPVRYYAFDLLSLDGRDLTPAPYHERLALLAQTIEPRPAGPIFLTPRETVTTAPQLDQFLDRMAAEGLEGAVVKKPNAPYPAGHRQYAWVKLKHEYRQGLADTFDLVIVGYRYAQGKRARLGIGSVLCCAYDRATDQFRTLCWVGSGLTDPQWIELRTLLDTRRTPEKPSRVDSLIVPDVWVLPQYVVEVKAGGIMRSPRHTCGRIDDRPGYTLRFPRIVAFRFDRRPDDATTQAEVLAMARIQAERAGSNPSALAG